MAVVMEFKQGVQCVYVCVHVTATAWHAANYMCVCEFACKNMCMFRLCVGAPEIVCVYNVFTIF